MPEWARSGASSLTDYCCFVLQMGHSLGLFHVSQGDGLSGCFPPPFGGDEVDDTPAQEMRGDDPFGRGYVDPQSWCPADALDTCLFIPGWVGHVSDCRQDTVPWTHKPLQSPKHVPSVNSVRCVSQSTKHMLSASSLGCVASHSHTYTYNWV
jgi:hypothetical protein